MEQELLERFPDVVTCTEQALEACRFLHSADQSAGAIFIAILLFLAPTEEGKVLSLRHSRWIIPSDGGIGEGPQNLANLRLFLSCSRSMRYSLNAKCVYVGGYAWTL